MARRDNSEASFTRCASPPDKVGAGCDWIIDLGPEGGDKGGEIIATGTPEEVAENKKSYTGKYLKAILKRYCNIK